MSDIDDVAFINAEKIARLDGFDESTHTWTLRPKGEQSRARVLIATDGVMPAGTAPMG